MYFKWFILSIMKIVFEKYMYIWLYVDYEGCWVVWVMDNKIKNWGLVVYIVRIFYKGEEL